MLWAYFFSEGYVGLVLIKAFARLVLCLTQPKHGFNIVAFENNYCFWTPKWGEKSVAETSTLSKALPSSLSLGPLSFLRDDFS